MTPEAAYSATEDNITQNYVNTVRFVKESGKNVFI